MSRTKVIPCWRYGAGFVHQATQINTNFWSKWDSKWQPSLKLTVRPWKWMVGILSRFLCGAVRPVFQVRCLLVSGRVSSLANWEVSNLIANVTVAFALAVLLTYSLVGLADTGPGEGIQLAGGRDQSAIGSARYRLWNVFETLEILWSFESLMFLKWTCNVWFERSQQHLFLLTWWDLYVRSQLDGFCWNCRILLWMHQFCHPNVRRPWQQGNLYPNSGASGANGKVFSYVCGRFKDLKVWHWSTLIHMNEYLLRLPYCLCVLVTGVLFILFGFCICSALHSFKPDLSEVLTLLGVCALFIVFGAVNYAYYGAKTQSVITLNLPHQSRVSHFLPLAFALASLFNVPLFLLPAALQLEASCAFVNVDSCVNCWDLVSTWGQHGMKSQTPGWKLCCAKALEAHFRGSDDTWKINALRATLICGCAIISLIGKDSIDAFIALILDLATMSF